MDDEYFWIPSVGDYAINRSGWVRNRLGQEVKVDFSKKGAFVKIRGERFYIDKLLTATFEMWFPLQKAVFEKSYNHDSVQAQDFEDEMYVMAKKRKVRRCHKCGGYSGGNYWCSKCRPFNLDGASDYGFD